MQETDNNPLPDGVVWNMKYAENKENKQQAACTSDELWNRVTWFLNELLPIAEEAGVRLAAHPDDPPVPFYEIRPD